MRLFGTGRLDCECPAGQGVPEIDNRDMPIVSDFMRCSECCTFYRNSRDELQGRWRTGMGGREVWFVYAPLALLPSNQRAKRLKMDFTSSMEYI